MTSDLGTMALESGARIDFAKMRRERLARALDEMEREGLGALLLGRESNARYASGARRLWTVGARPFAPTCVVVRSSRQVHLLTTWDDGVPAEIPHERLYRTAWNPENLIRSLAAIPGLALRRLTGIPRVS